MSGEVKAVDVLTGGLTWVARGTKEMFAGPEKPDYSGANRIVQQEQNNRKLRPNAEPFKEKRRVNVSSTADSYTSASDLLASNPKE